jgi:hypothetical protein
MFDTVDQLKEKLDAHRPLPAGLVKNLRDFWFSVKCGGVHSTQNKQSLFLEVSVD